LRCYDASNVSFDFKIKNISNDYLIEIDPSTCVITNYNFLKNAIDSSNNTLYNKLVFIYGKLVDNFTYLKKDAIWTVATAALQEVDRQLVSEKEKVAILETEVTTLETKVTTLETEVTTLKIQMTDILARVSSLESASTTDASDNTTTTA